MKYLNRISKQGLTVAAAWLAMGAPLLSYADGAADTAQPATAPAADTTAAGATDAGAAHRAGHGWAAGHRGHFRMARRGGGMMVGVCVGQELAAQGIMLAKPVAGQKPPALDAATRAAFKTAMQGCRAEFQAARHHHEAAAQEAAPAPAAAPAAGDAAAAG